MDKSYKLDRGDLIVLKGRCKGIKDIYLVLCETYMTSPLDLDYVYAIDDGRQLEFRDIHVFHKIDIELYNPEIHN